MQFKTFPYMYKNIYYQKNCLMSRPTTYLNVPQAQARSGENLGKLLGERKLPIEKGYN